MNLRLRFSCPHVCSYNACAFLSLDAHAHGKLRVYTDVRSLRVLGSPSGEGLLNLLLIPSYQSLFYISRQIAFAECDDDANISSFTIFLYKYKSPETPIRILIEVIFLKIRLLIFWTHINLRIFILMLYLHLKFFSCSWVPRKTLAVFCSFPWSVSRNVLD